MKLNRMLVVMSACTSSGSDVANTNKLRMRLHDEGLRFDEAEGCYKGVAEASFVVQCANFSQVGDLVNMADSYEQESVMLVDARNKAFLLYCKGCTMKSLGYIQMKDMSVPGTALPEVAYTKVGDYVYYTI
ncbi:hypothetical protein fHeYen301_8 [Yersinia phage fHe-Yen3-01]|uniref:Uncharacterized protein n=1 Tax=Yersinia phage fHe-Yen3-01 TaxID=1932893 RepID=A0A1L7DQE3_9CAUD|nr:SAM-dependent methyltransferase [Yersinia phage fHe-Yen3-01]APU00341.1 hypothetical protein fHeYen301_8 [Yersinia phage fHe-Yen3-01]